MSMRLRLYVSEYHKIVAMHEFGIYNWKQHSTGWLIGQLRGSYGSSGWYSQEDETYEFWRDTYMEIVKEVLAARPNQTRKRQRNDNKHVNKKRHPKKVQLEQERYHNRWYA